MAAGQLVIPVAERKPSKQTKDNTYVSASSDFYRYETDKISLGVHRSRRSCQSQAQRRECNLCQAWVLHGSSRYFN